MCAGKQCVGGPIDPRNDNNPCTGDSCHATKGCQHTPIAGSCDDDDACTVADKCVGGNCQGAPYPCNEPGCTIQTCVEFIGLPLCLCL